MASIGGFGGSKNAAQIILDKQEYTQDKAVQNLQMQRLMDGLHPRIIESVLELAQGFGATDATSRKNYLNTGRLALLRMTSERDASAIEELLRKWSVELFQELAGIRRSKGTERFRKQSPGT